MAAHRDDIESDLSAIHRIDDTFGQPAQRMLRLAYRVGHYPGIIRNLMLNQPGNTRSQTPASPREDIRWTPSTPEAIARSPLSRYISTTTIGGDPHVG